MLTIFATMIKELLELRRDRAGLLVLLVMPMALVLIVSLVQDSVMQATGEAPIKVLFVDADHSSLSQGIGAQLRRGIGIELVDRIEGKPVTAEAAKEAVQEGEFQFALIIPAGTGAAFRERMAKRASAAIVVKGEAPPPASSGAELRSPVTVFFDPAVQGTFRAAVVNALRSVILGIEFSEQAAALADTLPEKMKKAMGGGMMNPFMATPAVPEVSFRIDTAPLLTLDEEVAYQSRMLKRPTAAQQNVPAWALFGMFFIVVPLSGSLIRERQTGTLKRLMTMPVSPLGILAGKLCAYVLVCLAQFALMLAAGRYLLPLLGTSGLVLDQQLWSILPIALAAALAASGYGIMIGTISKSYEQASMFGAVSVVIAAAVGGIMIPVYVMPRYMQELSAVSPLAWGLNAFQDVLVRGAVLTAVSREITLLLAFFVVTITVSWFTLSRNRARA